MSGAVPEPPEGAEVLGRDLDYRRLPGLYGEAWGSVLAATDEAFGCVLLESLAAGTPVAAARSGAVPEILISERTSRLFEPGDPEGCAKAMLAVLDLGADPDTAEACKSEARRHDWPRVVEAYEDTYRQVLSA